jgi:TorA maturation chaperone TorD
VSSTATPLWFHAPLVQEDEARAGYYALLGRLFYAGPDADLLQTIAGSAEIAAAGGQLAGPWNALAAAARATEVEAARLEYDELFVGTGKAEVTPYASFYLAATGREKILVRLKQELASLGLGRAGAAREPEDHFAGLFEVMRHLISQGSDDAALQKQRGFFSAYIERSFSEFCRVVSASEKAKFYKDVSRFASSFLAVESEALKVF